MPIHANAIIPGRTRRRRRRRPADPVSSTCSSLAPERPARCWAACAISKPLRRIRGLSLSMLWDRAHFRRSRCTALPARIGTGVRPPLADEVDALGDPVIYVDKRHGPHVSSAARRQQGSAVLRPVLICARDARLRVRCRRHQIIVGIAPDGESAISIRCSATNGAGDSSATLRRSRRDGVSLSMSDTGPGFTRYAPHHPSVRRPIGTDLATNPDIWGRPLRGHVVIPVCETQDELIGPASIEGSKTFADEG